VPDAVPAVLAPTPGVLAVAPGALAPAAGTLAPDALASDTLAPTPGVLTPDAPALGDTPAPRGLDDLYDIARLADRLGVEHATIRVWLSRKVPWLPPPDGRLNGGAVWRAETLLGVEERRRPGRPGPKRRAG